MKLTTTPTVNFGLRTLDEDQRLRILGIFDELKNWENDPHLRRRAKKLPDLDVYVLTASDGMRVFFRKEEGAIQVVDLASKETIEKFANAE